MNWIKFIVIVVVILYMVINESERIKTRRRVDRNIYVDKFLDVYFYSRLEELEHLKGHFHHESNRDFTEGPCEDVKDCRPSIGQGCQCD